MITKKIGLVVKPNLTKAVNEIKFIAKWAKENDLKLVVDPKTEELLHELNLKVDVNKVATLAQLPKLCELVITLGGDGTLIGVARLVTETNQASMLGVNFGTLGYLTEIKSSELDKILPLVVADKASVEKRSMLIASVINAKGEKVFSGTAINDAVIHKGAKQKLLSMEVSVNDIPLTQVRADGLVVATPTGSTAYSMAAGGSVVYPSIEATLITPICPHSLTIRPLILPAEQDIQIKIPDPEEEVYVTVDGQVTYQLQADDKINISKAPFTVSLIRSPDRSYFDILKNKIHWGIPNRAD